MKRKRKLGEKNNSFTYIAVLLLAFSVFLFFSNFTGNIIYNRGDYTATDFAPPFDVFSNNNSIFNVTPENSVLSSGFANFSVSVFYPGSFIYREAYFYNNKISDWESFNFTQQTIGNSEWIYGSSDIFLSIPSEKLRQGLNLFAVYACKKISDRFECGCQDSSQRNCKRWMLQIVNVSVNSIPNAFSGGDGTSGNPYQITTWAQLNNTRLNLSASYILMNNLNSSSVGYVGIGNNWIPIGDSINKFSGDFNGSGHIIEGLNISNPGLDYAGLFGYSIGKIYNLGLVNVYIFGANYVGCIAGRTDSTLISYSFCSGNIIGSGLSSAGGLVGYTVGTVSNCYSTANVTGVNNVGGLIGVLNGGTVINSYSNGKVTASTSYVGGLIGSSAGGTVTKSYWDSQTSGQSKSAGGMGWVTAAMKKQSTYVGWDFTNTWAIDTNYNEGYPYLIGVGLSQPTRLPSINYLGSVLYVSPIDNSLVNTPWGCDGSSIPGAQSDSDGWANTLAIVGSCPVSAALVCANLDYAGKSNWYLPSINQLKAIYDEAYAVPSRLSLGSYASQWVAPTTIYWSSTEAFGAPTYNPWYVAKEVDFRTGYATNTFKNSAHLVRCVHN